MALQVWLPLNGNLNNQGLANIAVTNNGATILNDGIVGQCYNFGDGTESTRSKGININNNLTFLEDKRSICVWVRPKGNHLHYSGAIASSGNWNNSTRWGFCLKQDNTGFSAFDSGFNTYYNTNIPINTWTHLCVTVDRGITKFYKNGEYLGSQNRGLGSLTSDASNFMIGRETYASGYFSFNGDICDVQIYDHCLSPKEVHEIAKGLVLHYTLDDPYIEPTTNLITTSDCLFSTCYNAATNKYGYGTTTDIYKTTGIFNNKFGTKVYMGTSGNSAYPYVYVASLFVSNGTNSPAYKTLSFDFYTNNPNTTYIIPYKLSSGTSTCTWFNNVTSTKTGSGTNSANIPVLPNMWNHITMVLHGTTDADAQWGYIRLGNAAHTSNTNYYWLFANMQLETKDHETGYEGIGGTRTSSNIKIYDVSGIQNLETTISGDLTINNSSSKYNYCTNFNGSSYIYITSNFASVQTVSFWAKWNSIPSGQSVVFVDNTSGIGFGLMSTGILCSTSSAGNSHTFPKTSIIANKWYHFVIIKTSTTGRDLWINGEKQTQTSSTATWTYTVNQLQIGKRSTTSDGFNGQLSDFRMYAIVLSENDIKDLYQTVAIIDSKPHITLLSTDPSNIDTFYSNLYTFDYNECGNNINIYKNGIINFFNIYEKNNEALAPSENNVLDYSNLTGVGTSSWTLQPEKYRGSYIYKNLVTSPNTSNNSGFRIINSIQSELFLSGGSIKLSFFKRLNVSYGVNVVEATMTTKQLNGVYSITDTFNITNWSTTNIGKWIYIYASLAIPPNTLEIEGLDISGNNATGGDCDFANIQLEYDNPSGFLQQQVLNVNFNNNGNIEADRIYEI